MPFVRIQLKAGRTPEQKEVIAKEIIDAMDKHNFATRDSIKVIFEDMLPENFITDADLNKEK
ncbi:4-oxalocrotonate tautomerase [Aerococcus agrisoli]|uniref:4-oxalocrotonate tautomerase n=1 Tax=Aerococcus agrisoli TaxID=2487350 RepID=A0A3N4GSN2_9LACT|nr:tautomerase family protein [Aerococcus agrisoli]RPA63696.1 4-oxalocrotonate tautomerase [Aerococcus agrisoli]